MKIFQLIAPLLLLGGTVFAQPAPHLAYVYPAGGKAGSTFQMTVGGQNLMTVSNAFVRDPFTKPHDKHGAGCQNNG